MTNGEERGQKQYDLEERLIQFSVRILDLVEALPSTRVGNHIAGQLVRCGTSPAPNYAEARSAESRKDFIHFCGERRNRSKEESEVIALS
ncbi:MAG: four helix bundle protein [candidate division NC10 bacterium]|nr:four helix bundle protein [candidate division NC10 bacterium]